MPGILLITLYALGLFSLPTKVWGRYFFFYYPQDRGQRDSKVHPTMKKGSLDDNLGSVLRVWLF